MDIIFSKLTLFAITIMMITAFIAYSVTAIRRVGNATYFKAVGQVCHAVVKSMGALAATVIGFLASGTTTSDENKASDNTARSGVLNYRTGKRDDGTDPHGWYDHE